MRFSDPFYLHKQNSLVNSKTKQKNRNLKNQMKDLDFDKVYLDLKIQAPRNIHIFVPDVISSKRNSIRPIGKFSVGLGNLMGLCRNTL